MVWEYDKATLKRVSPCYKKNARLLQEDKAFNTEVIRYRRVLVDE